MKYFQVLMLIIGTGLTPVLAQSSFNEQMLTEGETALIQQDLTKAYRYLEIAAFGLMDNLDQYARTQMDMALTAAAMKDKVLTESHLARVMSVMSKRVTQPSGMPEELWERYQVLAGLKAPPPPPLPKDVASLKKYVDANPKIEQAWLALLRAMVGQSAKNDTRSRIDAALTAIPGSEQLRAIALNFSLQEDRGRDAVPHAKALVALKPDDALANEVLANQAVKDKRFAEAAIHYAKVAKPKLAETAALQQKLDEAAKQEQKKAEAERARKKVEQEKPKLAADRNLPVKPKQEPSKAVVTKLPEKKPEPVSDKPKPGPVKQTQTVPVNPPVQAERQAETAKPESAKPESAKPEASQTEEPKSDPRLTEEARIDAEIAAARVEAVRQPSNAETQFRLLQLYLEHSRLPEASSLMNQIGRGQTGESPTYAGFYAQYNYLSRKFKDNVKNLSKVGGLDDRARVYLGLSYLELGKHKEAAQTLKDINRSQWPVLKGVDQVLEQKLRNKRSALSQGRGLGRA